MNNRAPCISQGQAKSCTEQGAAVSINRRRDVWQLMFLARETGGKVMGGGREEAG